LNKRTNPVILLTNDDGIHSPGLTAAAAVLSRLGHVFVAAPREQQSATGRSMPGHSDGVIEERSFNVNGESWIGYAVGGTPAQVVGHALLELMPAPPDLIVAGINYGENIGSSITVSGTIGAALEGASYGIAALAVSLEMLPQYYLSYSEDIDFGPAAFFTQKFAAHILRVGLWDDVDVLKIDVPAQATNETPWRLTRVSRKRYFVALKPERKALDEPASLGYRLAYEGDQLETDSDVYTLKIKKQVAVSPVSLDLTARVSLADLEKDIKSKA